MRSAIGVPSVRSGRTLGDLLRCQHAYPCGRKLQRQGHAVEPEADLGDGGRVVRAQPEMRVGLCGPLHEQPYGGETAELGRRRQPQHVRQPE